MPAPRKSLWQRFKKYWSYIFFLGELGSGWAVVTARGVSDHFTLFSQFAHALWSGHDPYGAITISAAPGILPSPFFALFFVSWFAWLPDRIGQSLFLAVSIAGLVLGLSYLLETVRMKQGVDLRRSRYRHFFWLMLGSEALGAILAMRIELLVVGMLLFAIGLLMREKHSFLAGFLLALAGNWRFESIPVVALSLVPLLALRARVSALWGWLAGTLVSFGLPLVALGPTLAVATSRNWLHAARVAVSDGWSEPAGQHFFAFVNRTLSIRVTLSTALIAGLLVGVGLVVYLALWLKPIRKHPSRSLVLGSALLIALGLGAALIAVFGPLSRSNDYVLYTPLLIPVLVFSTLTDRNPRKVVAVLLAVYFVVSIAYSDLTPRPLRQMCYGAAIKPLGVIGLSVWLFSTLSRYRSYLRAQQVSVHTRRRRD